MLGAGKSREQAGIAYICTHKRLCLGLLSKRAQEGDDASRCPFQIWHGVCSPLLPGQQRRKTETRLVLGPRAKSSLLMTVPKQTVCPVWGEEVDEERNLDFSKVSTFALKT